VCTGLTENKHFGTRTTGGPFYLETDAVLEPAAGGTRVMPGWPYSVVDCSGHAGPLPGAGGGSVAVEHFGLVLVPRGGGAVGVDDQGPAPPVDDDLVVERARERSRERRQ